VSSSFFIRCWLAASADKKVVGAIRFMLGLALVGGLVAQFSLFIIRSWTPVQEARWVNVEEVRNNAAERAFTKKRSRLAALSACACAQIHICF